MCGGSYGGGKGRRYCCDVCVKGGEEVPLTSLVPLEFPFLYVSLTLNGDRTGPKETSRTLSRVLGNLESFPEATRARRVEVVVTGSSPERHGKNLRGDRKARSKGGAGHTYLWRDTGVPVESRSSSTID